MYRNMIVFVCIAVLFIILYLQINEIGNKYTPCFIKFYRCITNLQNNVLLKYTITHLLVQLLYINYTRLVHFPPEI